MNPLVYYEVVRELNNDKLRTAEKRRLASSAARMPNQLRNRRSAVHQFEDRQRPRVPHPVKARSIEPDPSCRTRPRRGAARNPVMEDAC